MSPDQFATYCDNILSTLEPVKSSADPTSTCEKMSVPKVEPFNCLQVPVPEEGRLSIEKILEVAMSEDVEWKCSHCSINGRSKQEIKYTELPKLLVLHLKRFSKVAGICVKENKNIYNGMKNIFKFCKFYSLKFLTLLCGDVETHPGPVGLNSYKTKNISGSYLSDTDDDDFVNNKQGYTAIQKKVNRVYSPFTPDFPFLPAFTSPFTPNFHPKLSFPQLRRPTM